MNDAIDLPAPRPLSQLASERVIALFLDFDGTLVELAQAPGAIAVPDNLPARLRRLADQLGGRLALVTGRSLADLGGHCPIDGIACAGSHGADRRDAGGKAFGAPATVLPTEAVSVLRQAADQHGLFLEVKPHGAALHFRTHPEREATAREQASRVADRFGLAVKAGKSVFELTANGAEKGQAVRCFMERPPFIGAAPVFVGDDVTDEDGIAACNAAGGFGVVVGDRAPTAARFRLPGVPAVYQWLNL